jgi:hypothetical protein
MSRRLPTAAVLLAVAHGPALAHPGEHGHMTLGELARHLAEPDHLAFRALCMIVGWLGWRPGRRLEAGERAHPGMKRRERP